MHCINNLTSSFSKSISILIFIIICVPCLSGQSAIDLIQAFSPATIAPGSASALTFTITNNTGTPLTGLTFSDTLDAALSVYNPSNAQNSCQGQIDVVGGVIQFSNGRLGGSKSCTVQLLITGNSVGSHQSVSSDISSDGPPGGSSSATLTLENDRPTFTKSFSPATVNFGERTTLTFNIDNSDNNAVIINSSFVDNLPDGITVADPPNVQNSCLAGDIVAIPESSSISFSDNSINQVIGAGGACAISVDVVGGNKGSSINVTGDFISSSSFGGISRSSGLAAAELNVLNPSNMVFRKEFLDDPYQPGSTGALKFTITNNDRGNTADNISFADDLSLVIPGMLATGGAQSDACGTGSSVSVGSTIQLTDGQLQAEDSCMITVPISIPSGADQGIFSNTTTTLSATRDRIEAVLDTIVVSSEASEDLDTIITETFITITETVVTLPATDDVFITKTPVLTKSFSTPTVTGGSAVTLSFTLNNLASSSATDIAFTDNLDEFMSGVGIALGAPSGGDCPNSSVTIIENAGQKTVTFSGGTLGAGLSCSFDVDLTIPLNQSSGAYLNETSDVTSTIESATVSGAGAEAILNVVGAPNLEKSFNLTTVLPGNSVDVLFTITQDEEEAGEATSISFTDDLSTFIPGALVGSGLLASQCGGTVSAANTSFISFNGGGAGNGLDPGESCQIIVPVDIPSSAAQGVYTNNTSNITAAQGSISVEGPAADADLNVSSITFTKEFTDDPVLAGNSVDLTFTISNNSAADDLTGIIFQDNLSAVLNGLVSTSGSVSTCGGTITGTSFLIFSGGSVGAGQSCTISVSLLVPDGALSKSYANVTTGLSGVLGGTSVAIQPASDQLVVENIEPLGFTKSFSVSETVSPATVGLTFEISNSNSVPATGISFTDDLSDPSFIPGATASNPSTIGTCGTLVISGANSDMLSLTGGSLNPGESCSLSVDVIIPSDVPENGYLNTTSQLSATIDGASTPSAPAEATLDIVDRKCLPVIQCPNNMVVNNETGLCGATVIFAPATDVNGCPGTNIMQTAGGASGSFFDVGVHTITYQITDAGGNTMTCSFTITVLDIEDPVINCPGDIVVCEGDPINPGTASATDNCPGTPTISDDDPGIYGVGTTIITYIATDASGNSDTCQQTITVHPKPTVSISYSELPDFCQGVALTLTATASTGGDFLWSTGETGASIDVDASDTYSVIFTDGNNCEATASIAVTVTPEDLLSAYTIISTDKDVNIKSSKVLNGGIGVMTSGEKARIEGGSDISGATTFVKASEIDVKGGSIVTNQIIGVPAITLPPFVPNTASGGDDIKVNKNEVVVLTESVYKKVEIEKEATVTFTASDLSIEDLVVKKDAIIKFSQCTEVKIEKDFKLENNVVFNPDSASVTIYAEKADFDKGVNVFADIYTSGELKVKGTSNDPSFMTGLFIGERVDSNKDVTWDWNTDCSCPGSSGLRDKNELITEELRTKPTFSSDANSEIQTIEIINSPNPFVHSFRLQIESLMKQSETQIVIVNLQQQEVFRKVVNASSVDELIDASEWSNGVYFVTVTNQNETTTLKVLKAF